MGGVGARIVLICALLLGEMVVWLCFDALCSDDCLVNRVTSWCLPHVVWNTELFSFFSAR